MQRYARELKLQAFPIRNGIVFKPLAPHARPKTGQNRSVVLQVEAWEKRLGLLSETLDEWVAVQRNWMYLETIFCAEDIQKQLPDEAAKFQASRTT